MADPVGQLIAVFFAGAGLFLAGGVNVGLRRSPRAVRGAATLLACGGAAGAAVLCADTWRPAGVSAALMAIGVTACLLAGTRPTGAMLRRQAVCWGLLAVAGVVVAVGSVVAYDLYDAADVDRQLADFDALDIPPPNRGPATIRATTDRGTEVPLLEAIEQRSAAALGELETRFLQRSPARERLIRHGPADDSTNCHGWVFTGGRCWIGGANVDLILTENRYQSVSDPQPGDLVVYRSGSTVLHTALVRYVTAGQPVMVEGKWGVAGRFLHQVDQSVYGTGYTYYRSPRQGHLLAGLN